MIYTSYQSFVESMNEGFFDKAKAAVGLGQLKKFVPLVTNAIASAEKFSYTRLTFQTDSPTATDKSIWQCQFRLKEALNGQSELGPLGLLIRSLPKIVEAYDKEKDKYNADFKRVIKELDYMFGNEALENKGTMSVLVPEYKEYKFVMNSRLAVHDDKVGAYTPDGTKNRTLNYLNTLLNIISK
jgi:hypothetical protein